MIYIYIYIICLSIPLPIVSIYHSHILKKTLVHTHLYGLGGWEYSIHFNIGIEWMTINHIPMP